MTANDPPRKTTSEIGGIRAPSTFQAIDAKYYNVTDRGGRPIAGLLVLVDRIQRPVRAELHLYDDLEDAVRESALRQSQLILQDRYYSREPVQLRVMHTFQERSAVDVPLPVSGSPQKRQADKGGINWSVVIGAIVILALVAGIIWGVSRIMGSRQDAAATPTETPAASAPAPGNEQSAPAIEADATNNSTAGAPPQTNGLAPSQNAHPDLAVGQQARIHPDYQLTLRSEPGAEAGVDVAYMQGGDQAEIIGGPYWTQGNSDTIVWWQVRLADGSVAWAAANTSELRLLEPVP